MAGSLESQSSVTGLAWKNVDLVVDHAVEF
jgi:hypothetical protein